MANNNKPNNEIIEAIPAAISCFLPDGTITFVNNFFYNYFNKTKEEILGNKIFDFFLEKEQKKIKTCLLSLTKESPTAEYEHSLELPDGNKRYMKCTHHAIYNDSNALKEYLCIGQDVTKERKTRDELLNSEHKLRNFVKSATEIILIFDSKFRLQEINDAGLKIFSVKRVDIIGKGLLEFASQERTTGRYKLYKKVPKTGKPLTIPDVVFKSRVGERHLEVNAFKIQEGIGFIIKDNTEEMKDKDLIAKQKQDLEYKNAALKDIVMQIGGDKRQIEEKVKSNVEQAIIPIITKIVKQSKNKSNLKLIHQLEENLREVTTSFGKLTAEKKLSSREVEICNLIRNGYSTSRIAKELGLDITTIHSHRRRIRRKLGITSKGINLRNYLQNP